MSEFQDIQALLDKFWEGETTLEEERRIKGYFATGIVDERLARYAPLFQAVKEEQAVQLRKSKTVPIRPQMYQWQGWAIAASIALLLAAGAWWMLSTPPSTGFVAETPTPVPSRENQDQPAPPPTKPLLADAKIEQPRRIAHHPKHAAIKKPKANEIDAEEAAAMAEIKAALALVSSKIKKGRQEATKGTSHLEDVDRIFKKKEG